MVIQYNGQSKFLHIDLIDIIFTRSQWQGGYITLHITLHLAHSLTPISIFINLYTNYVDSFKTVYYKFCY